MKSYHASLVRRKSRRDAIIQKMSRMRAAKERKRLAAVADEPPCQPIAGRHCYTITVHNRLADTMHSVDLYVSERRINAYRADVDGRRWKDNISLTRVLSAIRRKLPPLKRL